MSTENRTYGIDEDALTSERAFEWLRRLDTSDGRETEAFHTWLRRSPQNAGEMLVATSTELVMRQLFRGKNIDVEQYLSASANVLSIGNPPAAPKPRTLRQRLRLFAVAGVGIAAATAALLPTPAVMRDWLHPNEYATSIGEQRAVQLSDGSVIAINAQSSVQVAFSAEARDVYLKSGQAMFTVAKDPARPFRVHVSAQDSTDSKANADTVVQAIGTKFDIRRRTGRVDVAVVEGIVQVRSDDRNKVPSEPTLADIGDRAEVVAGQSVNIESSGLISPPAPINLSDVSAWQQRRLVFTDDTLSDIAEEFARYNRSPRIRIEGNDLRMRRFSGVFDADNPESLLKYLVMDASVTMARDGNDIVIRSHSSSKPAQPAAD